MMHMVNIDSCRYCHDCGGCDYVDVPYDTTLDIKLNDIKGLFYKADFRPENIEELKMVPSPLPLNYRTRCQLHVKDGKAGFHRKRSHDLIEIKRCAVLDERLNARISELKFAPGFEGKIELYIKDGKVCDRLVEKKYDNLFFQVNESVNRLMINEAVALCDPLPNDNILELYCGSGNFTFAILARSPGTRITGIDMRIPLEKKNNPEFIEADVAKGLLSLKAQGRLASFNKLLLDPPRSGSGIKVLDLLKQGRFQKIVYISCNPGSMLSDAQVLGMQGYAWKSTKLFDMFPFTKYAEAVSLFTQ